MLLRDYEKDKELIRRVLLSTEYTEKLINIANREATILLIDLDDIEKLDPEFCTAIITNTKRYVQLFCQVVDEILPDYRTQENIVKDTLDVFIEHRILAEMRNRQEENQINVDPQAYISKYPPELMRRYELYFKPHFSQKPIPVREVKGKDIGKFVSINGIVTRCAEVKPLMVVATYTCDACASETYQPIGSQSFMPLERCVSEECKANKTSGRLSLQTRGSKFMKFQEIRVQEHSRDVPIGNIPRSISVICRGEMTRQCSPGDHVYISGVFLPINRSGFRQLVAGLIADTYIEAHRITVTNKTLEEEEYDMNDEEFIDSIKNDISIDRLASSIAPEIYGHLDLKKALLLLLVGGVDQNSAGMKIRGAINICLMGDPGVAKSQLLGFIDRVASRSVYTNGRGSSGVGLTAAIMKDTITGEFVLEGGALVLADQGICCIDEFDKMLEGDRTAIHEVMEQQTISIAKAGIMTTLNARVSILAAANPVYGRYNTKKSVEHNIQLPAALLSRFDLLWLITDQPNEDNDYKLAQHISYVHQHCSEPPLQFKPLSIKVMRRFIQIAKRHNPVIPPHLTEDIIAAYIQMRNDARNKQNKTFTSPRTLLAILRLSTALARLRLSDVVDRGDITEAMRLIASSKASIQQTKDEKGKISTTMKIYQIVHDMLDENREVLLADALERCTVLGYTNNDFEEAVEEFDANNMWQVIKDGTTIRFVS